MRAKSAFTLIEITVAIFVITIGVVGIYALLPKALFVADVSENKFIASQLAREGIELIRNIRDSNWLTPGNDWDENFNVCFGGCEIDYNDTAPSPWGDRYLKIDSNGFYNYETGNLSKFKRKITILSTGPSSYEIKVEVFWPSSYSPFVLKADLYNWRQ